MEGSTMKKVFIILCSICFSVSAYAQTLRVTFNGNRDFQLVVDGKSYNSTNYLNDDIVLNNLSGEHNISIYMTNKRGKARQVYSSSINLPAGKEVHLTVNANGSIERTETSSNEAYGYRSPMADASFNELYRKVNKQWGQAAKLSTARDLFNTSDYYFSTDQIIDIIGLLNADAHRLELAKLAYDNVTDATNYYQVNDLLRSQASRNELDLYVRNNSYDDTNSSSRVAMPQPGFNQLMRSVRDQKTSSSRLSVATKAFNTATNYFSVAQAAQIISLLTGDNNRLQLAKLVIDNLTDMENVDRLFDLLSTQSSKEQLDQFIRDNGYADSNYNVSVVTAMTDAQFTSLYESIRKKWLPYSKYSAAVEAFSSNTNVFTTAQVRQIIALLSSESNKLELAKLAFDNVADKQNFRSIYDLFTTQDSKDELDSYLRTTYNYQY